MDIQDKVTAPTGQKVLHVRVAAVKLEESLVGTDERYAPSEGEFIIAKPPSFDSRLPGLGSRSMPCARRCVSRRRRCWRAVGSQIAVAFAITASTG